MKKASAKVSTKKAKPSVTKQSVKDLDVRKATGVKGGGKGNFSKKCDDPSIRVVCLS